MTKLQDFVVSGQKIHTFKELLEVNGPGTLSTVLSENVELPSLEKILKLRRTNTSLFPVGELINFLPVSRLFLFSVANLRRVSM